MPPRLKQFLALCLLLAVAGAAWSRFAPEKAQESGGKKPPVYVSAAAVVRQDVPLALSAVGAVVPYQSVTVRPRVDTQIVAVKFNGGDYVNEGDLLFQLDDRTLRAQMEEQKSNLARDRSQVENLKLQYGRRKNLASKGYETPENLQIAKSAYEAQAATVAATQAALENLQVQLQYTQVTAPISGRTGTVNLTPGNTVRANDTALVTINQVKPIWVQFSLPQQMLESVRQAMAAGDVAATAQHEGGSLVEGKLGYIDNAIDTTTGTFAARAMFDNVDESLWPGMFVSVTLRVGEKKDALTVPEVAIQHSAEGDYVYVIKDGKAERRAVKVALIQKGSAIVVEGVADGEQVAIDGMMKLSDGAPVDVAPQGASQGAQAEAPK
jgi:multidrug efflux system membrane fusion protein